MEAKREQSAEERPITEARATIGAVESPVGTVESAPPPAPALDFAELDLTVERVEERISPSETNVFDR